jgi:RNA polymerase sigma-70 factor (ECF subfamily)
MYRAHQPDVLAYFLRRLDRDDAVEATADVFLTAWRRFEEVPADPQARLWLFGVAHNTIRNRQRSVRRLLRLQGRLVSASAVVSVASPEAVVVRREQDEDVVEALSRLRHRDREVLMLRLWEEATYDEVASVLGCSRHAAEQRYSKALRRLRSVYRRIGHVEVLDATPFSQEQRS